MILYIAKTAANIMLMVMYCLTFNFLFIAHSSLIRLFFLSPELKEIRQFTLTAGNQLFISMFMAIPHEDCAVLPYISLVPHSLQNLAPGSVFVPHSGQNDCTSSLVPHSLQNFAFAITEQPQLGQTFPPA